MILIRIPYDTLLEMKRIGIDRLDLLQKLTDFNYYLREISFLEPEQFLWYLKVAFKVDDKLKMT